MYLKIIKNANFVPAYFSTLIPHMSADAVLKDLKNKKYAPIYLLHGEEAYYIDEISHYIETNILDEAEKGFNQMVLYGKDLDVPTLISHAKRYPMMAERQVVVVKEAQDLKKIDELLTYAENPLPSTLLVLCYKHKKFDARLKLAKTIANKGVIFQSDKLYDNKIPAWVSEYLSAKGFKINPKASQLIADYLGNDLSKVANELNKLILNVQPGIEISTSHIEQNIGISKDYNIFELQNAIGKKEILKANRIVNYFAANTRSNPFVVTIGTLYAYFSKLLTFHSLSDKSKASAASALKVNPFFVSDYEQASRNYPPAKVLGVLNLLHEYDLKSKGIDNGSATEGDLLKEMVFKILH